MEAVLANWMAIMFQTFPFHNLRGFFTELTLNKRFCLSAAEFAPHSYIWNMKKKKFTEDGNSSQLKAGYPCRRM